MNHEQPSSHGWPNTAWPDRRRCHCGSILYIKPPGYVCPWGCKDRPQ